MGEGRIEVYQDAAREWRWRKVAGNGEIVAESGEGYASQSNAQRAVDSVFKDEPLPVSVVPIDREAGEAINAQASRASGDVSGDDQ